MSAISTLGTHSGSYLCGIVHDTTPPRISTRVGRTPVTPPISFPCRLVVFKEAGSTWVAMRPATLAHGGSGSERSSFSTVS